LTGLFGIFLTASGKGLGNVPCRMYFFYSVYCCLFFL
jgi:hypothetical protein